VEWCMALDPMSRPQSVFALQKELSREGERHYTKLSMAERMRLQIDTLVSDTKKSVQKIGGAVKPEPASNVSAPVGLGGAPQAAMPTNPRESVPQPLMEQRASPPQAAQPRGAGGAMDLGQANQLRSSSATAPFAAPRSPHDGASASPAALPSQGLPGSSSQRAP
jgi:hypothetical protein